ncbi:MAG: hypothetical protein EOP04_18380 [Proteobacteria bacterium]|nr:MAG: hypothetical protein EOP04_18380 [Pseudomonadota bacterium]
MLGRKTIKHRTRHAKHHNNPLVEAYKAVVFGETVTDQVCLDSLEEVPVECGVDDEVEELLNAIPVLVDDVVLVTDLEARWYPDVEDTDVNCSYENCSSNHDVS